MPNSTPPTVQRPEPSWRQIHGADERSWEQVDGMNEEPWEQVHGPRTEQSQGGE